ncbi:MAG: YkgJ family cysteine cluster protein [Candidatus Gastranaerophilales bacterium]|nr:YkgJ family cysteine cluster protein [Candidatus Gastranaerophilales bacterium]
MISLSKIKEQIKRFYHLKILKRKYYRLGKCAQCGCCCENIYVRHQGKVIQTQEEFEEIIKTDNYSFYKHISIINKDDFGLVFSCDKFDKEKRLCTDHKNRPSICKNYPSEEIFSFGAQLQDKCGYKFEPIIPFFEIYQKISKKEAKTYKVCR